MTMETWRPRSLRVWQPIEEMERFFEDPFFADWPFPRVIWRRAPGDGMTWAPALEVSEKDNSFIVRAELPGVKKDDVDISITGDTLNIRGERKASSEAKDENYYRREVCYGSFSRSVTMPASVDPKKIEASYEDGILEIRLPKAKEAMPTKVEIKVK